MTSFEALGKLLGPLTGALLVLSVGYDYGYLSSIDLTFAAVPTTITDHVRTAIVWAPANGVGMALGVLLGMSATESGRQPYAGMTRSWKQTRMILVSILLGSMSLLVLIISTVFQALLIVALVLAGLVLLFGGSAALIARFGHGAAGALFMVPFFLFSTTFAGSLQGPLLFSGSDRYSATIKVDSIMVDLKDVGMRRFGSFALLGERSRKLHIVPDSSIVRVEREPTKARHFHCYLSEWLCPERRASAPGGAASTATLVSTPPMAGASANSMPSLAPVAATPTASSAPLKP